MKTLRIGLCCHSTLGGSSVVAAELANGLASKGHSVHLISAQPPARFDAHRTVRFHPVATPTHPLLAQGDFALALASRLFEVAAQQSLDILHVHYALPLAVSAFLARQILGQQAVRLVTTVHGTDVLTLGQDPAFRPVVQLALQSCDALTAPTQFLARATREAFGLAETPELVPNFVDANLFRPVSHQTGPTKTLIHSSNFRSIKRVQDAVAIFATVRRSVECELVLIGDGPERAAVEAVVESYGVTPFVHFDGAQRDVVERLQQASVFLMPSEMESFGLAALEAMSCGVPVVASAVGGLVELVNHGLNGFLHVVGDVEAMAASVTKLLQDPTLHRRMAQAARLDAEERWSPAQALAGYENIYRRVMRFTE